MKKQLYAAYGANLNLMQMGVCCPTAKAIAKSWIFEHKLVFKGSPRGAHATIVPEKDKAVPVVIWEISEQDEATLDRHMGVNAGYYTKAHVTLEVDGEMQEVLIYIMSPCDYGMPTKKYLDIVTRGYLDFNLPTTVLEEALAISYESTIVYKN